MRSSRCAPAARCCGAGSSGGSALAASAVAAASVASASASRVRLIGLRLGAGGGGACGGRSRQRRRASRRASARIASAIAGAIAAEVSSRAGRPCRSGPVPGGPRPARQTTRERIPVIHCAHRLREAGRVLVHQLQQAASLLAVRRFTASARIGGVAATSSASLPSASKPWFSAITESGRRCGRRASASGRAARVARPCRDAASEPRTGSLGAWR